jgi:hypothetical protein
MLLRSILVEMIGRCLLYYYYQLLYTTKITIYQKVTKVSALHFSLITLDCKSSLTPNHNFTKNDNIASKELPELLVVVGIRHGTPRQSSNRNDSGQGQFSGRATSTLTSGRS